MEKRTIIAFALSFLVLIIWSMLFTQKHRPAPEKARENVQEELPAAKPETIARQEKSPAPAPMPKEVEPAVTPETHEKGILVETPLYRAIFSSAGAAIKSFQLKKYRLTFANSMS